LDADEPQQNIGHPGVLGLYWEDGYGRVGPVEEVVGLRVTRRFELVTGDPPPTCPDGRLEDCSPVDLEANAYPSDPGDTGLEFEEISYDSPLGSMGAWLVPASGDRWAIHVHGWTAERREAIRTLPAFHSSAIASLVIDYRNDPGVARDPSGLYRFGLTEWEDLEAAAHFALDRGASELIMVGYSTGAAHIMSFLERSPLAPRVRGVVFDAPNISVVEAVRFGAAAGALAVTRPGAPEAMPPRREVEALLDRG
jgi:hypothetical protein